MGETVLSGLLRAGWTADQIVATDRRPERQVELDAKYGITMLKNDRGGRRGRHGDLGRQAAGHARPAGPRSAECLQPATLVVSLAAGVDTASIEARCPTGSPWSG